MLRGHPLVQLFSGDPRMVLGPLQSPLRARQLQVPCAQCQPLTVPAPAPHSLRSKSRAKSMMPWESQSHG